MKNLPKELEARDWNPDRPIERRGVVFYRGVTGRIAHNPFQTGFELGDLVGGQLALEVARPQHDTHARSDHAVIHSDTKGPFRRETIGSNPADIDADPGKPQTLITELVQEILRGEPRRADQRRDGHD